LRQCKTQLDLIFSANNWRNSDSLHNYNLVSYGNYLDYRGYLAVELDRGENKQFHQSTIDPTDIRDLCYSCH